MDVEFTVKPGFHGFSKKDAQVIGPVLLKHRTKEAVLDYGTPAASPIHCYFTWDNKVAGHAYRLEEAGKMFQAIGVPKIGGKEIAPKQRLFHSVTVNQKEITKRKSKIVRHYYTICEITQDKELSEALIAEARAELAKWKRKYETYVKLLRSKQFRNAMAFVDQALKQIP